MFNSKMALNVYLALFILLVFSLYSISFSSYPILETGRHSVLGETDVSSYRILIQDFQIQKKYGDPYRLDGRDNFDIAQKHKIHHILYVAAGNLIHTGLVFIYGVLGISGHQAVYSVNALLGCINIFLLYRLLNQVDPKKKYKPVFLIFYAFCLSSWISFSVPDSWTFSTTLMLFFLILHLKKGFHVNTLAGFVGIAMMNNVVLGSLCFFPMTRIWVEVHSPWKFLARCIIVIVIAIATWLTGMTILSVFDGDFRPDHYFQYTTWYKSHIAPPIRLFDTYYWKAALTQLYVTSIVSNQSIPNVPQESLLYTIQQSRLGLAATLVYIALSATIGWRGAIHMLGRLKESGGLRKLLKTVYFPALLYMLAWLFLTMIMDTEGAFLYSVMVTPMLVIFLYRFTDWQYRSHIVLWAATIASVLINNAHQIMTFRSTLAAMTP